ncbi:MAG TPA: branched-chain amino acid ABC transporter permease [bacterium]|nr:branched-chain amino acid ABC transporter permease [bacterium]
MITKKDTFQLSFFFIIMFFLPVILNSFQGGGYYIGIFVPIGFFTLTALGLNLLIGFAGQISLGHAGFMTIGAYSSVYICNKLGYSALYGFALSILLNFIIGFLISKPILKLKGHYLAMATLGIGLIIQIISREFMYFGGGEGISLPDLKIFDFNFNDFKHKEFAYYYLVWLLNFCVLKLSLNFINSKAGRALKALHINELAAQSLGINVTAYKTFIFVFSTILAGISGSIAAHYNSYILPTTFDLHTSIKLVTMVILGGTLNIWGTLFGVFILMIIPELLGKFDEYEGIVLGAVLIVILLFLPDGLTSIPKKLKRLCFKNNG